MLYHGFENSKEVQLVFNENISKTSNLKRNIGYEDKSQLDSPKRSKYSSSNEKAAADKASEEDMNLLPEEFNGFPELPVPMSQDVANKACTEDELSLMLYGFDSFEDVLDSSSHEVKTVADNIPKMETLKRVMSAVGGDVQEDESDSSKQREIAVIAESPVERFKLVNALRRLAQSHNKRGATLDKREVTLDKREASVERREASVERREVRAENKEALLLNVKSDEPAKDGSIAENIEMGKDKIEKAGSYVTLADNILHIPTKSKEMVKGYKENKAIAQEFIKKQKKVIGKKLTGYVGAVATSGVLDLARETLIESLKEVLGVEANNGGEAGGSASEVEAEAGVSVTETESGETGGETEAEAAGDETEAEAAGGETEAEGASSVRLRLRLLFQLHLL